MSTALVLAAIALFNTTTLITLYLFNIQHLHKLDIQENYNFELVILVYNTYTTATYKHTLYYLITKINRTYYFIRL